MYSNHYSSKEEDKRICNNNSLYCNDCFSYTKEECICGRIIGYDARTDIPIVDLTPEEVEYIYSNQKKPPEEDLTGE